jgi:hypothetical protein
MGDLGDGELYRRCNKTLAIASCPTHPSHPRTRSARFTFLHESPGCTTS